MTAVATAHGLVAVTKSLQSNDENIKEIRLYFDNISTKVLEEFVQTLETCKITPHLSSISFCSWPPFQRVKRNDIQECIIRIIQRDLISLKRLEIVRTKTITTDGFAGVLGALSHNVNIKYLKLSQFPIARESITAITNFISSGNCSIEVLDFATINGIGNEGCAAIMAALSAESSSPSSIKTLKLTSCGISKPGTESIAKALKSKHFALQHLDLSGNKAIGNEGCGVIMDALRQNKSVRKLDLSDCEIGDNGIKSIVKSLQSNQSIESLFLGKNKNIGLVGLALLADLPAQYPSFKELSLPNCGIDENGIKAIVKALQSDRGTSLEVLCLNNNKIGVDGSKILADALIKNTSLTTLDLFQCDVRDQGCIALMNSLSHNSSLKAISLKVCNIGYDGAKAIANFLRNNTGSLEHILLKGNSFDKAGSIEIANALPYNTRVTKLGLHFDSSLLFWEQVLRAFDDALRHNFVLQGIFGDFTTTLCDHHDNEFVKLYKSIEERLLLNRTLGPIKAEIVKRGLFPRQILPRLTSASCFVEVLCKVVKLGRFSAVFDLIRERPTLFQI